MPSWLSAIAASYEQDPVAQELITKLSVDSSAVPHFTWHAGILRCRNKIWLGADKELQNRLIAEFHASAWGSLRSTSHMFQAPAVLLLEGYDIGNKALCPILFNLPTVQI